MRKLFIVLATAVCLTLLCSLVASASTQQLFVADRASNAIHRYDASTGAYLGEFQRVSQLDQPMGMAIGPDGLLYVTSSGNNRIVRFDVATGVFVDVFATIQSGLYLPDSLAFGLDGKLYVSNYNNILRFDIATGAHEVFVQDTQPHPSPGLRYPSGIVADQNGTLYAGSLCSLYSVYRFDITTGNQIETYPEQAPEDPWSWELASTGRVALAPNGDLYVATMNSNVFRYDPIQKQFINIANINEIGLASIAFSTTGSLYLVREGSHEVFLFNSAEGRFDQFTTGDVLRSPSSILVATIPEPTSMLALGCGLVGFVPTLLRRRKR